MRTLLLACLVPLGLISAAVILAACKASAQAERRERYLRQAADEEQAYFWRNDA